VLPVDFYSSLSLSGSAQLLHMLNHEAQKHW
jgi:hypothetical protein